MTTVCAAFLMVLILFCHPNFILIISIFCTVLNNKKEKDCDIFDACDVIESLSAHGWSGTAQQQVRSAFPQIFHDKNEKLNGQFDIQQPEISQIDLPILLTAICEMDQKMYMQYIH